MRMLITGREGQIVRALRVKAAADLEVIALGRPDLDLARPDRVAAVVMRMRPDVIVNAAAYTAVDKAEQDEALATIINGASAGALATAAAELAIPIVQISTDYVFDGKSAAPYVESDAVGPLNAYGRSKLAGERAVAAANPRHAIVRTSWVYSRLGVNFLTTMLRLAEAREEIGVVADQIGAPTYAPDIADGVVAVARNLLADGDERRAGVFHMTGGGETSWAGFAKEIFRLSAKAGGPSARVREIPAADYPMPARRPANSRLNCDKLAATHGVRLPEWCGALQRCMNDMKKV